MPGSAVPAISVTGIPGLPEISAGDDLAAFLARALLAELADEGPDETEDAAARG